jgi:prepilin-type N-terminal cleavage/methylation domain-containing protein
MPKLTRSTRARPRSGFTLTELMVSLVMFGVVSGIIMGLVRSQQRFYRGATEIIDVRSQLRQAAAVLPLDLRSVSTVSTVAPAASPYQPSVLGSDIRSMNDHEVWFRATIGSGVVCQKAGNVIALAPVGVLARGNVLTSWYTPPLLGDTVFVFDRGANDGATDDQWWPYVIAPLADDNTPCAGSPLLSAGDAGSVKKRFALTAVVPSPAVPPPTVDPGAVVRFTRKVAYGLYPSNGSWYLGYRSPDAAAGGMTAWQPVSGPYRSYAPGGTTNGMQFFYYDSLNAVTTDPNAVSRIDVVLRGAGIETRNAASFTSQKNNEAFTDSLLLRIAIRNRS